MTVTCNYRSTAVIILPGVYLPPQRNATVADDAFSLLFISIHAPREGSDDLVNSLLGTTIRISIHAPREGSDVLISMMRSDIVRFQSTLPARGATGLWITWTATNNNFNPRSPRGERGLKSFPASAAPVTIPGRSPRGERGLKFLPRMSRRTVKSRSPRGERGLKYVVTKCPIRRWRSLPSRGAWIEICWNGAHRKRYARRSPRGERGLKSTNRTTAAVKIASLPSRGAWIEIVICGCPCNP